MKVKDIAPGSVFRLGFARYIKINNEGYGGNKGYFNSVNLENNKMDLIEDDYEAVVEIRHLGIHLKGIRK